MQLGAGLCRRCVLKSYLGVIAILSVLFGVSACSTSESAEIIASSPTAITITTNRFVEPTALAEAHCAKHGRKAVVQGSSKLGSIGYQIMWGYECVEK